MFRFSYTKVFYAAALLAAVSGCASLTDGPAKTRSESLGIQQKPDETSASNYSIRAELTRDRHNIIIRPTVSFTAPIIEGTAILTTEVFVDYIDRRGNVVGRRLKYADVWFDCEGCGRPVDSVAKYSEHLHLEDQRLTGESRHWELPLTRGRVSLESDLASDSVEIEGNDGGLTFNLARHIQPAVSQSQIPVIFLRIESENGHLLEMNIMSRLTDEEVFEIWSGVKNGEISDQELFVRQLQRRLLFLGYGRIDPDGISGDQTKAAAKLYASMCRSAPGKEINPTLLMHLFVNDSCGYFAIMSSTGIADASNDAKPVELFIHHEGGSYLSETNEWMPLIQLDAVEVSLDGERNERQRTWEQRIMSEISFDREP